MKVFCSYDSKYDCFFKQLVEYVLERYGDALDISSVREIELVKEIDGIDPPDGRLVENGKKILIAERMIRELPHLNIAQLGGEESFKKSQIAKERLPRGPPWVYPAPSPGRARFLPGKTAICMR